jgi:anti-anti-sigma factor
MHEATIEYGVGTWPSETSIEVVPINLGRFLVSLAGELDIYFVPKIKDKLQTVFNQTSNAHLILDLTDVTYADGEMLKLLLAFNRKQSISLIVPQGNIVRHLLDKLGLTALFVVCNQDLLLAAT